MLGCEFRLSHFIFSIVISQRTYKEKGEKKQKEEENKEMYFFVSVSVTMEEKNMFW